MHLLSTLSCKAGKHRSSHFTKERGRWRALSGLTEEGDICHPSEYTRGAVISHGLLSIFHILLNVSFLKHFFYSFTSSEVSNSTPSLAAARHLHTACVQNYPSSSQVLEALIKEWRFQVLPGLTTSFLLLFHIHLL